MGSLLDLIVHKQKNTIEFGEKLILKITDIHDLILMKCAADRLKDAEDVKTIIETQQIIWRTIIEEAKHQMTIGKTHAIFKLGNFLEKLKKELKLDIPKKILDELYDLLIKETKEKKKKII